ncbi:hypothetical protein SISSUDRAFT_490182 [Sistotremastrum suecicum HHB10207 ss-3]|uniref:Uncharacterized protein n=1 Tax=Sistotremastrum suecicum HHB10207 ss-3 TaxID=1314776 RepID=A0A165XZL5_9AGAM|nr:hypothetical protein SISSUDRAFT_490182 [Sistotremastrum suecicum HHB10207 ss-3]
MVSFAGQISNIPSIRFRLASFLIPHSSSLFWFGFVIQSASLPSDTPSPSPSPIHSSTSSPHNSPTTTAFPNLHPITIDRAPSCKEPSHVHSPFPSSSSLSCRFHRPRRHRYHCTLHASLTLHLILHFLIVHLSIIRLIRLVVLHICILYTLFNPPSGFLYDIFLSFFG